MTNNNFENFHFNSAINYMPTVPDVFDTHWHKYPEILYFPTTKNSSHGSPQIRINQTDYFLNPGDILFIWQGELHATIANGHLLKGLQFPANYITELPEFQPLINLFRLHHHIRQKDHYDLAGYIMEQLDRIESLQRISSNFKGVEALMNLYQIFIAFGNDLMRNSSIKDLAASGSKTMRKITQICQYIADNCERDLTLDYVAAQAGLSTCYFSRLFKATAGNNFVEYLTLQRVKRAQMLLAESTQSITDISYQAGFKSISTFNRVFRQYKGCSPSEYRKYYVN